MAWSELGIKKWKASPQLKQASLVKCLTGDFSSTCIFDGNSYSFQEQGIAFKDKLEKLSVPVKSHFFNKLEQEFTHEYRFDYSKSEAKKCYSQSLSFIKQYKTSS